MMAARSGRWLDGPTMAWEGSVLYEGTHAATPANS